MNDRITLAETVRCARAAMPELHAVDDDEPTGRFVRVSVVPASTHRMIIIVANVVGGVAGAALSWWLFGRWM